MRRRLPALPPAPTAALPGTPEKVAVLRERARLRQALWHPRDATLTDANRTRRSFSRFVPRTLLNVS